MHVCVVSDAAATQANQKRQLNEVSLEQGKFTTLALQSSDVRDIVGGEGVAAMFPDRAVSASEIAQAMAAAEDESDVSASKRAELEATAEMAEFSEQGMAVAAGEEGDGDGGEAGAGASAGAGAGAGGGASAGAGGAVGGGVGEGRSAGAGVAGADGVDGVDDLAGDEGAAKKKQRVHFSDDGVAGASTAVKAVVGDGKPGKPSGGGKKGKKGAGDGGGDGDGGADDDNDDDGTDALLAKLERDALLQEEEQIAAQVTAGGGSGGASGGSGAGASGGGASGSGGGGASDGAVKFDRVKAAVRRMQVLESQLSGVDRRSLGYREFVDPHPWVLPEVIAAVEATFATEEHEWELDQIDAIRV